MECNFELENFGVVEMSMIIINKYYILPIENGRYMIRWYRKLSSMDIRFLISFHYKYDLLSCHLFYYFKCLKCPMVFAAMMSCYSLSIYFLASFLILLKKYKKELIDIDSLIDLMCSLLDLTH